jgi:hypothetical protein
MTNTAATEITARAAAISSHEEWIAFMTDDENITEFAHEAIGMDRMDLDMSFYGDQLLVAGEVQYYLRLEIKTDAELLTEYVDNERAHREIRLMDGWDYDMEDYETHRRRQGDICALMEFRRIRKVYMQNLALTHNPFLALQATYAA